MFFAQTDYWNKEDEADILSRCKRTGEKTWESVNGYLPNCPLIPVPEFSDISSDPDDVWKKIFSLVVLLLSDREKFDKIKDDVLADLEMME